MEKYYRIMYLNDEFTVCCLQDFDEMDYDKESELPLKFKDEDVAKRMVNILNETQSIEFSI